MQQSRHKISFGKPLQSLKANQALNTLKAFNQQGIGLIEVMIAVFIFIGSVMAVNGMQTQALRVTHDSLQRSHATWVANAAVELMRLNPDGLNSSIYQTEAHTASTVTPYCSIPPKNCIGATCSSSEMAQFDIFDLMCNGAANLINPNISINCTASCTQGDLVTFTINWDSRGAALGAAQQELTLSYLRN